MTSEVDWWSLADRDCAEYQLWEILVPTIVNGKPCRLRFHRVWDKKINAIAKGLTILTPTKGQWVSADGQVIAERMIPVRIAANHMQMLEIAKLTAEHYKQKAVMFYVVSPRAIIYTQEEK